MYNEQINAHLIDIRMAVNR